MVSILTFFIFYHSSNNHTTKVHKTTKICNKGKISIRREGESDGDFEKIDIVTFLKVVCNNM